MKGRVIIKGLSGSPGVVTCKVRIVRRAESPGDPDWEKLTKTEPGECLVSGHFGPGQDTYLKRAAGLIADTGDKVSHGMVRARDFHIPGICDCETWSDDLEGFKGSATNTLKDGQVIMLEGYTSTEPHTKTSGKVVYNEMGHIYSTGGQEDNPVSQPPSQNTCPPLTTPGLSPRTAELLAKYKQMKKV